MNLDDHYISGNLLVDGFIQSFKTYPDRPAIEVKNLSLSYAQLANIAQDFAVTINNESSPEEDVIAVLSERSLTGYAGILGCLLASKGYMPLNDKFPVARNLYMLEKSGVRTIIAGPECAITLGRILEQSRESFKVILDDENLFWQLKKKYPHHHFSIKTEHNLPVINIPVTDPAQIAYLLFTSGSTGVPKGVPVKNSNASAYLNFMLRNFQFYAHDRFSHTFDLTFDLSVHDLFLCWSAGACLCVPQDNSSFGMAKYLKESRLTIWFSVPSVARLMSRMRLLKQDAFPNLRYSFFCGEPMYMSIAEAWSNAASSSEIINLYGPTEATIAISLYRPGSDYARAKSLNGILSIGKIFEGQRGKIIDDVGEAVRLGETGELCLAGTQVVDGYLAEQVLSDNAFFNDIRDGLKWYRTGDLVVENEEGELFFMGRKDTEVKVSGYRVNLLEVEHVAAECHGIQQAVAHFEISGEGSGKLICFLLPKDGGEIDSLSFIEHCRTKLPWYMIPEKIIFVDQIPLNPNGKTDKKALLRKYFP